MHARPAYELIDFGGGARLERFGDRVVDRPHPVALGSRRDLDAWRTADLRFDRERGWTGPAIDAGLWTFEHDGLTLELRPTEAGQVGLFPEHLDMLPWLAACVDERAAAGRSIAVLHLFAYTGLATLAMAAAGAEVTHVDASRPTVAWARRNAELSGLLTACGGIIEPGGFALLTAHTPGFDADRLDKLLDGTLGRSGGAFDGGELAVSTRDGHRLDLGAFIRRAGGA
jgi:hypothetical protein